MEGSIFSISSAVMGCPGSLEKHEGMGRERCLGKSLVHKYLLSIYCVPDRVSGAEGKRVHKKDKSLCSSHL